MRHLLNLVEERDKLRLSIEAGYVSSVQGYKDLVALNKQIKKQLRNVR